MDKTNINWWNSNIPNLQGITVDPDDQVLAVATAYEAHGTIMVRTLTSSQGSTEFPVYKVTPVFKKNRAESGLDLTVAVDEMRERLQEMTAAHERAIEEAIVDPDPKNPRTYLPEFAWPEFWQPGRKKAMFVKETLSTISSKSDEAVNIGDVFTVEFAVQSSPDGQAIVNFIDRKGRRQSYHWTFVVPYKG